MNFAKMKARASDALKKGKEKTASMKKSASEKSNELIQGILKDLAALQAVLQTLDSNVDNASLILHAAGFPAVGVDISRGENIDLERLKAESENKDKNSTAVRWALAAVLRSTKLDPMVKEHGMRAGMVRVNISANPFASQIEIGLQFNECDS